MSECDQSTAIHVQQLEDSIRQAFQAQDVEKVLELDQTLLNMLSELRQQGFTLPMEQRVRLKELYQTICREYQGKHQELSTRLGNMRQSRNALSAYQQCQTAGY